MRNFRWFRWVLAAVFSVAALGGEQRAQALGTIPVKQIRRGMVGYGLTVLHGMKPEKFRVRVIGILHNVFPKQDLIVIMCDDPKLAHFGVAAGMSGSPIYFNGKLAGALSYGPVFSKDPIAMVTPIGNMLAELKRPLHGMTGTGAPGTGPMAKTWFLGGPGPKGRGRLLGRAAAMARRSGVFSGSALGSWTGPGSLLRRGSGLGASRGVLRPLAVPVTLSGFDAESFKEMSAMLGSEGIVPVQGGAGGSAALARYGRVTRFVDGGSIGVQFVRGDFTATGTGTVTHVVGHRLVAFGHPFMGLGEVYMPVVGAWIHMVVPSIYSSYKMSTPLNVVGSLTQDRKACIAADSARQAPMIPMLVRVHTPDGRVRSYKTDVISHPVLAPNYLYLVLKASIRHAVADVSPVYASIRMTLDTNQAGRLTFVDSYSSMRGAWSSLWPSVARGVRVLQLLFSNPFANVVVRSVTADVNVEYHVRLAKIDALSVSSPEVEPGSRINLGVTLQQWRGKRREVTVPVDIPNVPDGTLLRIHAAAGLSVTPDHAPPRTFADLVTYLKKTYSSKQLVVTVRSAAEVASVAGRLVSDLPGSVVDSLRRSATVGPRVVLTRAYRKALWLGSALLGSASITVRVQRRKQVETK